MSDVREPGRLPHPEGIHHISAICSDPQRNIDFYVGLLGLRLVKRTVNFDDPGSWHLYYGDGAGSPGTLLTFFAWTAVPPLVFARARDGTGQVAAPALAVAPASLDWWIDRLADAAVAFDGPELRFGERFIALRDPDGMRIELIARAGASLALPWPGGPTEPAHAIRGLAGATVSLAGFEATARLLTGTLGFREHGREGDRFRFLTGPEGAAAVLDVLCHPEENPGRTGIGSVHHIAWRTADAGRQRELRSRLLAADYDVTPVLDRKYFESIYFREPGGVLFEIATDGPGFTVDEEAARLGSELQLPAWLEPRRARIGERLPAVRTPPPGWRYRSR